MSQKRSISPDTHCPQCRSTKIDDKGVLQGKKCRFCGNEWSNISTEEIEETLEEEDKILIPEKFSNPLTISSVNQEKIRLKGSRGGEYKLCITEGGKGLFRRKKSPSERNQFGGSWKNSETVNFEIVDN